MVKEDVDPSYVFGLRVSVGNGEISNVFIILPLPIRNNMTFYGINEIADRYNSTKGEREWIIQIVETEYGNMLGIKGTKINEANDVGFGTPFYKGGKINAKYPLENEYLLTLKFNISEASGKIFHEELLIMYQSKYYLKYNSSESTIVSIYYSFSGWYPGAPPKGYSYHDRLEELEFIGPQEGWVSIKGNVSSGNLNRY